MTDSALPDAGTPPSTTPQPAVPPSTSGAPDAAMVAPATALPDVEVSAATTDGVQTPIEAVSAPPVVPAEAAAQMPVAAATPVPAEAGVPMAVGAAAADPAVVSTDTAADTPSDGSAADTATDSSNTDTATDGPAIDATPAPAAPTRVPDVDVAAVTARLRGLFPALFGRPPKPIKLRVQEDIQARAPNQFSKRELSAFFRRHTLSTSYLLALVRARERFDLDGQPAGPLSDEHREAAQAELARRRDRQQQRLATGEAAPAGADGETLNAAATRPAHAGERPPRDPRGERPPRGPQGERPPRGPQGERPPGGPQGQRRDNRPPRPPRPGDTARPPRPHGQPAAADPTQPVAQDPARSPDQPARPDRRTDRPPRPDRPPGQGPHGERPPHPGRPPRPARPDARPGQQPRSDRDPRPDRGPRPDRPHGDRPHGDRPPNQAPRADRLPAPQDARSDQRPRAEQAPRRDPAPNGGAATRAPRPDLTGLSPQELQQRQDRARLLRDYETTRLSEANFCALKGMTPQQLAPLLAQARSEAGGPLPPKAGHPPDRPRRG